MVSAFLSRGGISLSNCFVSTASRNSVGPKGRRCRALGRIYSQMAPNVDQLKEAKKDLADLVTSKNCAPILVRLAWHDAGTYNKVWRKGSGSGVQQGLDCGRNRLLR